jgi:starch synthase
MAKKRPSTDVPPHSKEAARTDAGSELSSQLPKTPVVGATSLPAMPPSTRSSSPVAPAKAEVVAPVASVPNPAPKPESNVTISVPRPQPEPFGAHIALPATVEKMVVAPKPTPSLVAKPVETPLPAPAKPENISPKPALSTSVPAQPNPVQPVAPSASAKPALPAPVLRVAPKPQALAKPVTASPVIEKPALVQPELVAARKMVTTSVPPLAAAKAAPPSSTPVSKPVEKPAPVSPVVPAPAKSQAAPVSEAEIIAGVPALKPETAEKVGPSAPETAPPVAPRPAISPMYVVMIAPELAPVAKVGGLGDVVYGLARELEIRGNSVEIILPKYNHMRYDHIWGLTKVYENLWVPWYGGAINTSVWFGFVHGRKCFFLEPHSQDNFFNRSAYYGQNDDVMRFAFFCRAALEFMLKTNKHPEVIHCHDWQTALVPVLLYEMYQHLGMRHSRVCFTVHNFRHQGVTGGQILQATGLHRPEYFFHYDRMRDNKNAQALNLMKAGIVYSNFTTTVSPRHAWEAKDAGQGDGLEPTLHTHHYKFGGVLNGLDYEQFNPESDPHIPAHFNAQTMEKKYDNKRALRQRFWLTDNEKPIIAFIGRLDQQKGLELVRHSIFYAINNRAQFVLLGNSPERGTNDHFLGLKHHLNNSPDCHLEIGYHEELAHLIYAGADMLVVPSRYEPCGLTQLISLRYGTVPIVRSVGGLADTVFDKDYSNRPLHERNGYVFGHGDHAGVESALHRAIACYYEFPEHWRQLMLNGMKFDYSWNDPGQHYLNIYDFIRDK